MKLPKRFVPTTLRVPHRTIKVPIGSTHGNLLVKATQAKHNYNLVGPHTVCTSQYSVWTKLFWACRISVFPSNEPEVPDQMQNCLINQSINQSIYSFSPMQEVARIYTVWTVQYHRDSITFSSMHSMACLRCLWFDLCSIWPLTYNDIPNQHRSRD